MLNSSAFYPINWPASLSLGEGWWRRGESNPRSHFQLAVISGKFYQKLRLQENARRGLTPSAPEVPPHQMPLLKLSSPEGFFQISRGENRLKNYKRLIVHGLWFLIMKYLIKG